MPYLVRVTSRFQKITHYDATTCYEVIEVSGDGVLQGPGEIRETLDGLTALPALRAVPARVPREIPNWRCKAVLLSMGLLEQVEAMMGELPEPQKSIVALAWTSDGKVARDSATVKAIGAALNLSASQIDNMFLAAEAINI